MKKIPYGIINYKELITEGYEYIDKTMYLEKLENIGETLIYLRPGRFGKSLFTSMMFYYYDVNSKDEFDSLFSETYVGKNPTSKKNSYYILKFDFSGISTETHDIKVLKEKFKSCVLLGIETFINDYNINYTIEQEKEPDEMLRYFLNFLQNAKLEHKVYIIIDEYDNFTNAILEGDTRDFLAAVGNTGFVKSFYSNIKIYVKEGIVDKVFITGICPITLNSMTTGFNIATDISTDVEFNSMIGLTHEEVKKAIDNVVTEGNKDGIFDVMVKQYDGYLFNKKIEERVFNATLVMYFIKEYNRFNTVPDELYDKNVLPNYDKIEQIITLQDNPYCGELIEEIFKDGLVIGELETQFNLQEDFTRNDIVSLLYYFGFLTIRKAYGMDITFEIPNQAMRVTYGNFFRKLLKKLNVIVSDERIREAIKETRDEGKIEKIVKYTEEVLNSLPNRMFMNYDEKYIQVILYNLLYNRQEFETKVEYECLGRGYFDLFLEGVELYSSYNIMIELKYIKKGEKNIKKLIEEKRLEGIEQLQNYKIDKDNLKKYLVLFVGRDVKLLEEII